MDPEHPAAFRRQVEGHPGMGPCISISADPLFPGNPAHFIAIADPDAQMAHRQKAFIMDMYGNGDHFGMVDKISGHFPGNLQAAAQINGQQQIQYENDRHN